MSPSHKWFRWQPGWSPLVERLYTTLVDHCYVTDPWSYFTPRVVTVGDSDHLGQVICQLAKNSPTKPNTIKFRTYVKFDPIGFQMDLVDSRVNEIVSETDTLE